MTTGLFLVAVVVYGAAHIVGKRGGPRLRLATHAVFLGDGLPGETVNGSFEIDNVGREPLTFQLLQGCGCTTLEPRTGTVPVGESLEIKVGLRLAGNGRFQRSIKDDWRCVT